MQFLLPQQLVSQQSILLFSEIPVIPDLDDFQDEDLANKIAAPPRFVYCLFQTRTVFNSDKCSFNQIELGFCKISLTFCDYFSASKSIAWQLIRNSITIFKNIPISWLWYEHFLQISILLLVYFSLFVCLLILLIRLCKDDEIDLKLLGKVLAPESTVFEVRMTRHQWSNYLSMKILCNYK